MAIKKLKYPATSIWIKTARKNKKLTQKALAAMLNISKRSLENYESGVVDVPTSTAVGIAKICDFPPPFFDAIKKDQSTKLGGEKGGSVVSDPDTTAKYISLLEQTIGRLERENEELKVQMKKSSKNPKTPKKK